MQLDLRDVAQMLRVPENKIYHWINEEQLPARQVNGKYCFDRAELLEWATIKRLEVLPAAFSDNPGQAAEPTLAEALERGGVSYNLAAADKSAAMRAIVAATPLPDGFDRASLLELFQARESLGSTGVGDGIAIPHPRHPVVLPVNRPSLSICFLSEPLNFGATDKKPVHTLFVVISPTIRAHMQMLARISRSLGDGAFREILARRGSQAEILDAIRRIERSIDQPSVAVAEAPGPS